MLLSRNNLFNFRATFSLVNNKISARLENSTDWKDAFKACAYDSHATIASNDMKQLVRMAKEKFLYCFRPDALPIFVEFRSLRAFP